MRWPKSFGWLTPLPVKSQSAFMLEQFGPDRSEIGEDHAGTAKLSEGITVLGEQLRPQSYPVPIADHGRDENELDLGRTADIASIMARTLDWYSSAGRPLASFIPNARITRSG